MAVNLDKLEKMNKLIRDGGVDRADLVRFMQSLMKVLNENYRKNNDESKKNRDTLSAKVSEALTQLARYQKQTTDTLNRITPATTADVLRVYEQSERAIEQFRRELQAIERLTRRQDILERSMKELQTTLSGIIKAFDRSVKPATIRDGLEALKGDDRLDVKAIRGLTDELDKLRKSMSAGRGSSGTAALSVSHWPLHESFTMNGSDTTVTLSQGVGAAGTAIFGVRYQGQTLDIDNQYTVSGNKITLDFTPVNGSTISVSYMP